MSRWLNLCGVMVVAMGLFVAVSGCTSSNSPEKDKMGNNKMSDDKMGGKMGSDKMGGDKMSDKKSDKMDDKMDKK